MHYLASILGPRERGAMLVLLGIAFLSALVIFYWVAVDTKPPFVSNYVKTYNSKGEETKTFRRGERIYIERENCARKPAVLFISREIVSVDGFRRYALAANQYVLEAGCVVTTFGAEVPPSVPPGEYKYRVFMLYSNNPLQSGIVALPVFRFTLEE